MTAPDNELTAGKLLQHLRAMPMTEWVWSDALMIFDVLERAALSTAYDDVREVLEPFAKFCEMQPEWQGWDNFEEVFGDLTVGDFRRARELLSRLGDAE